MSGCRTVLAVVVAAAALACGCGVQGFCIDCELAADGGAGDGRDSDGGGDGGGTDPGTCVSPGSAEECNGRDDDCDGRIDEGPFPGEGVPCGKNVGECRPGATECLAGQIQCGGGVVNPRPELCDNRDNDCDQMVDEKDPGGGGPCGTNTGECVAGIERCVGGSLICTGSRSAEPERCDGLDNDCDAIVDEAIPPGPSCGLTDVGECRRGSETCIGGAMQCMGAVYPRIEQCDARDHDCDGNNLNGFDLNSDTLNCGACGHVCTGDFRVMEPHVQAVRCSQGTCAIATCQTGWWNNDGIYENGCEYPCNFRGMQEACNGWDDDCDGRTDEALIVPQICSPHGECRHPMTGAPIAPTCTGTSGWRCDYLANAGDVSVDANGDLIPEASCDNKDNDCDQRVDEAFPSKGGPCDDGRAGICRGTGTFQCVPGNPSAPPACRIDRPGSPMTSEACNSLDDDCDGRTDEGALAGALHDWVPIGGGIEAFAYESSRPDATSGDAGVSEPFPCSRAGVLPWTNVTYPEAESACLAIGGRLCREAEWQRACELPPAPRPIDGFAAVEAENFTRQVLGTDNDVWTLETAVGGYAGSGYMRPLPDDGDVNNTNYTTQSPRLDFDLPFTVSGTYYLWVLGYGENSGSDSCHAGIDNTGPASADRIGNFPAQWQWRNNDIDGNRVTLNVPSAGLRTIHIWMREDGFRLDKILLTVDPAYVPLGTNPEITTCDWSYATSCTTYQPLTCNGKDYDTDPATPGDQDGLIATGTRAACYADWGASGGIYDLSGNAKEWTRARAPGVNPIRGGAYNNVAGGLDCQLDFTVANDSFFFPNVGFRCCRGP